jgi:UDP-hydrolysing UDP-N-acetyl-D-glucosamine 2-epimerase
MRKICVITGSRAEYGLLNRLMKLIKEDPDLELQIIVTNMHLSPEFGMTYKEIEKDGFKIDRKVEILLASDTPSATVKSVGLANIGFADAYQDLKPDIILVLGDRYEILAAVTSALFFRIPVAHIHGGEVTEGAYDDSIRHAISKMSHLHFTSTDEYRKRVIQLGEDPQRVFNVGALGIDNIKHFNLLPKKDLEECLDFQIGDKCILVTFHPVTLENNTAEEQFLNLLRALEYMTDINIIFTYPNSDTNGRIIIKMIDNFVSLNINRAKAFASLGSLRYMSVMQFVGAVVGNSSSGIIEAPSIGIPTVNIGNRQKGRLHADTVVDCEPRTDDLLKILNLVLSHEYKSRCQNSHNPYEKKGTANEIHNAIKYINLDQIINKCFYNL